MVEIPEETFLKTPVTNCFGRRQEKLIRFFILLILQPYYLSFLSVLLYENFNLLIQLT